MVQVVQLLFPAFGLLLLGIGVQLVRKGRFYSRQAERVAGTQVTDVGSLEPGTVAVEGTAGVDGDEGTVTTALTGEEALLSRSEVVAKEGHAGDDGTTGRQQLHEEARSVPFLVDDGTGSVRVDPPGEADVRLDGNTRTAMAGEPVPDVADLADDPDAAASGRVSVGDSPRWTDYRREYEQAAIVPGEDVYVLGQAVDRADWDGPDVEIAGGEHPERFVVSDEGREAVQSGGKIGAYLAYLLGGGAGLLGALLLFGGLAVLL